MRKILALILAMTLALSCMSIATSAYGAGETFGIYAGGWGADATVAIPQAGTYTITADTTSGADWLMLKSTAADNLSSLPEGAVITTTELKIDGVVYELEESVKNYTVDASGKIEIQYYLTPNFGGSNNIVDYTPVQPETVSVTFTITDPAPEAEAPTETVNTIIDDNFDAEDATIGGWYHHWGNSNNDIVDGALFTNRGESNIMYSTGHDIGAMTAGNTYAVTLKLMVPDEEDACADGKVTATVFFKTDGLDGDVLARKNVELDVNTWSDEVKLTFKAKADVAKAVLCINFDGEGWGNFNPAGLYVDDVLLTETVPAPEPPEEGTPDNLVTIGGKDYLRDEVIDIVGETAVPGSWAWTNLCSYSTTPTVGQVLTALQNENTYLEIDGYAGKIIIQGEGASPSTDSATMVKGKLGYYDLKAVMNAYVTTWNEWVVTENAKIEAANQAIIDANNALPEEERLPEEELELAALKTTVENAYNAWNLVMQNTGSELTIAGAKVVTLTPYVAPEEPVEGKYTGWFVTGPETHAMRIGRAIITLPHEYNANGDCIYCRHHTDLTEEDVEIEVAYESETEETEDDVVVEDENPTTGVALALVPMAVAAVAVISKRR